MKIRSVGAELFHADGQTDRHDEANSRLHLVKLVQGITRQSKSTRHSASFQQMAASASDLTVTLHCLYQIH